MVWRFQLELEQKISQSKKLAISVKMQNKSKKFLGL